MLPKLRPQIRRSEITLRIEALRKHDIHNFHETLKWLLKNIVFTYPPRSARLSIRRLPVSTVRRGRRVNRAQEGKCLPGRLGQEAQESLHFGGNRSFAQV